jgi:hypothetical protein
MWNGRASVRLEGEGEAVRQSSRLSRGERERGKSELDPF